MSFDGERKKHALEALQTILSLVKQMPVDFDSTKELGEARDEKYGKVKQKDAEKERD